MPISEKQKQFLKDDLPRMTIVEGCISSGKTFICNHKAIEHIINNYRKLGLIFFVGRTLTTLEQNVLQPLSLQYGDMFKYSINQKKATICGIEIRLVGCNDMPSEFKIRGSTAEFIYGDELTLWNKPFLTRCMGSLRVPGACFLGTTNPDAPTNFVKTDYLDRKDKLGVRNISFDMADNPSLTEEYIKQVDMEYEGVFHDRFIKGLWTLAEGLIYPHYQQAIVPTIDRYYTEYQISIDYGIQNPFAMGLYGLCNGDWHKVKEYHHSGRETQQQKTDGEYYEDLEKFANKLPIRKVIIDPSATSFITLIRRKGKFAVVSADNSVLDGIRETASALKQGLLFINDCCVENIKEFKIYAWDDQGEDVPIKESDHHMDETRYFVKTNRIAVPKRKSLVD